MKCSQCDSIEFVLTGLKKVGERLIYSEGLEQYEIKPIICKSCGHIEWFIRVGNLTGVKQFYSKYITDENYIDSNFPIEAINFSLRTYNCLKKAGINIVGDLTKKTEEEMKKVRNLGHKSLNEVNQVLEAMNLSFTKSN